MRRKKDDQIDGKEPGDRNMRAWFVRENVVTRFK